MDRMPRRPEHYPQQHAPAPLPLPPPAAGPLPPIPASHHYHPPLLPPHTPHTHSGQHPPPPPHQPSSHPPPNYLTLPQPQHSGAPPPPPSYHNQTPHGPPLQFPNPAKQEGTPDHVYGADRSGHGTPITRHPPEFPPPPQPPQRTPSTPAHPSNAPPMQGHDRPVEGMPQPYPPPHEQPSHYAPQYGPPHTPVHMVHAEPPPHHVQPMVDPNGYGQPHPGYPGQPFMYAQMAPSPFAAGQKKKTVRAAQACDKCRERKSKCDEERPTCGSCRENHVPCHYRDGQPAKLSEKNVGQTISDSFETLNNRIDTLESIVTSKVGEIIDRKLELLLSRIAPVERPIVALDIVPKQETAQVLEEHRSDTPANHAYSAPPTVSSSSGHAYSAPPTVPSSSGHGSHVPLQYHTSDNMVNVDTPNVPTATATAVPTAVPTVNNNANTTVNATVSDADADADPTVVFDDHTTAAHKLIYFWPSIYALVQSQQDDLPSSMYVLDGEARGPLQLYGRGEVDNRGDFAFGAASPTHSSGSDEVNNANSPGDNYYGPGLPYDSRRSEPISAGGLTPEGRIDLHGSTVKRLFESYKRHIHLLHPFLDIDALSRQVEKFINRFSYDRVLSPFINGENSGGRPYKRKRSDDGGHHQSQQPQQQPRMSVTPQPERSLTVAIIYLVMALGRVCEAREPLPGPVQEDMDRNAMPPPHASNLGGYGTSPAQAKASPSSPHSTSYGATPPSLDMLRTASRSRRSSHDGSPNVDRRGPLNIEKVPGLIYYREAVSILGDFHDSNELACAQGRLLAGLYKGQLARVQESWSWIHDAARICRYRVKREGLDQPGAKDRRPPPGTPERRKQNILLLSSFSCMQLESDILAELDYPHSGLAKLEWTLPYPDNVVDEDTFPQYQASGHSKVDRYYSGQLFLRKRLNQMHMNLYTTSLSSQSHKKLVDTLVDNESMLTAFKTATWLSYDVDRNEIIEPDILAARLLAKYYGAYYIATRPYLDYVLHAMSGLTAGETLEKVAKDAHNNVRLNEYALFGAISTMQESVVQEKAILCVRQAMRSTVALDAIQGRLVVTNIMGTSHAQFGNMLVLSAVYCSGIPWLTALIPEQKLKSLFVRTIRFLRKLRFTSKTAPQDIEILQSIHRTIFGFSAYVSDDSYRSDVSGATNTSFGSSNS